MTPTSDFPGPSPIRHFQKISPGGLLAGVVFGLLATLLVLFHEDGRAGSRHSYQWWLAGAHVTYAIFFALFVWRSWNVNSPSPGSRPILILVLLVLFFWSGWAVATLVTRQNAGRILFPGEEIALPVTGETRRASPTSSRGNTSGKSSCLQGLLTDYRQLVNHLNQRSSANRPVHQAYHLAQTHLFTDFLIREMAGDTSQAPSSTRVLQELCGMWRRDRVAPLTKLLASKSKRDNYYLRLEGGSVLPGDGPPEPVWEQGPGAELVFLPLGGNQRVIGYPPNRGDSGLRWAGWRIQIQHFQIFPVLKGQKKDHFFYPGKELREDTRAPEATIKPKADWQSRLWKQVNQRASGPVTYRGIQLSHSQSPIHLPFLMPGYDYTPPVLKWRKSGNTGTPLPAESYWQTAPGNGNTPAKIRLPLKSASVAGVFHFVHLDFQRGLSVAPLWWGFFFLAAFWTRVFTRPGDFFPANRKSPGPE